MSCYMICPNCGKGTIGRYATDNSLCGECSDNYAITDKLSVEKLQEELESCIQTLIEASAAANITQDIVVGNLVDRKLADLAKTHKLAVDYIEKVTGKNIHVVLAENAALEAEEENE